MDERKRRREMTTLEASLPTADVLVCSSGKTKNTLIEKVFLCVFPKICQQRIGLSTSIIKCQ